MFDTPQEAALKAEVSRLRAENEWLRKHVENGFGARVMPYGGEEDVTMREPMPAYRLPRVANIKGSLLDDGRWSVVAIQERMDRDKSLSVSYFTEGYHKRHIDDMTFVNHILPMMHERFIKTLADIFTRESR